MEFVWARSKATLQIDHQHIDDLGYVDYYHHMHYVKLLKKVKKKGFDLNRVLIIDDTPAKCRYNYGNAIYPSIFEGDKKDLELPKLIRYLIHLKDFDNMRAIEKRFWHQHKTVR